ncbi:MAG TPA: prolipoprotein diacylglyceryl transferase [Pseudonocardiaceae bacterium]|jgi:prolipoprotein diacylglyceryl transferase|nr:prolipoprotein diacylglyceryl transferase [Pseudonocardiaceae bacterium]
MALMSLLPHASIPSPPINGFHLGPLYIRFYGLMYVVGIALALVVTRRRWRAKGGSPDLVDEIALWGVPAGIIGGRIYFDITTPAEIPPHWWGVFAVWQGGLGIWGGIALAAAVGIWRLRRAGVDVGEFMDAVAPGILFAQAIGRVGNYFNQELFGGPTSLPWGLQIAPEFRPPGYEQFSTFHPTFLYELIWDAALAGLLIWLGHHRNIRPYGLFALYVTGYSAFRIFEESLRVDYSQYFLGLRLNFFVASVLTVLGIVWFIYTQRRTPKLRPVDPSAVDGTGLTSADGVDSAPGGPEDLAGSADNGEEVGGNDEAESDGRAAADEADGDEVDSDEADGKDGADKVEQTAAAGEPVAERGER